MTPIQLINAYAALANGGKLYQPQIVRESSGRTAASSAPFKPKLIHKLDVPAERPQDDAPGGAEPVARCATPTTSSTCRSRSPASPARPSSGPATRKGRLPYHSWFVGFVPKDPYHGSFDERRDSELVVLAFAYDSRTKGNAATEIVKYFLQLHYGIKKDYRNFDSSSAATSTRATDGRHPSRTRTRHRLGRQVRRRGRGARSTCSW